METLYGQAVHARPCEPKYYTFKCNAAYQNISFALNDLGTIVLLSVLSVSLLST